MYVHMSESKPHVKYTVINLPNCNCSHMQGYKEQLEEARKEAMQYKKELEEARKNAKKWPPPNPALDIWRVLL